VGAYRSGLARRLPRPPSSRLPRRSVTSASLHSFRDSAAPRLIATQIAPRGPRINDWSGAAAGLAGKRGAADRRRRRPDCREADGRPIASYPPCLGKLAFLHASNQPCYRRLAGLLPVASDGPALRGEHVSAVTPVAFRGGTSEQKGLAVCVLAIDKRPCFLQVLRAPNQTTKGATA
jgi:hypothetical protein